MFKNLISRRDFAGKVGLAGLTGLFLSNIKLLKGKSINNVNAGKKISVKLNDMAVCRNERSIDGHK
jgi:hypothetical protein